MNRLELYWEEIVGLVSCDDTSLYSQLLVGHGHPGLMRPFLKVFLKEGHVGSWTPVRLVLILAG